MYRKCLISIAFCCLSAFGWAQRIPQGLLDDMLFTEEQLQLPSAVVAFGRDNSDLDEQAERQVASVAAMMEGHPDVRFYLLGSYDNDHASLREAGKLCQRRCQAVRDGLVRRYGVDPSRLLMLPEGGLSQEKPQRAAQMVLVIACTRETEAVVQRWVISY